MNTRELIDKAVSLPEEERVLVIDSLLQSLNQPDLEIDKMWRAKAQKRLAEIREGSVTPVPGEQVFKRIFDRFEQ